MSPTGGLMLPRFKETKATQAAGELLRREGGDMNYMKLVKLLYLVDRASLIRRARPVTFDKFVSLDYGPVPSKTLDLINYGWLPDTDSGYWSRYISPPADFRVHLREECPQDELSETEHQLLAQVYAEYGNLDEWELVDLVHELPEWEDPEGSAIPIDYRDILKRAGRTDIEVEEILKELRSSARADRLFG